MSNTEAAVIDPYLNPEYWGGRMVEQPDTDPITRGYVFGQIGFSLETVNAYLSNRQGLFPIQTFNPGAEVDANDYQPGSLFYGNREQLASDGSVPRVTNEHAYYTVPEPPTDLSFELLDSENAHADAESGFPRRHLMSVDGVRYSALHSFIVVTRGRRGKHNLQPVNEHGMYRLPDGKIFSTVPPAPMDSPFKVGETNHTKMGSHSLLHRVNALMLVREGQLKKRVTLAEKLSSLVDFDPF